MKTRSRSRLITSALAVLAVVLAVTPTISAQENDSKAQTGIEQVYTAKCAMCHAADGSGNTPAGKKLGARDLRSPEVQKQSDAELTTVVVKGKNKMPSFSNRLSDEQIHGLIAHIRQLAKKP